VRLMHGQTPEDFTGATVGLRHVFGPKASLPPVIDQPA